MSERARWLSSAALVLQLLPGVAQGQQRSYTVTWLGIPLVDVGINVADGDFGQWVTYTAKTRAWFDAIYSIDNWYQVQFPAWDLRLGGYRKRIMEKGHLDSLTATYRPDNGEVVYSNGIVRIWNRGDHNFFSALIWLERRHWKAGERHVMAVEIEGVTWEVLAECREVVEVNDMPSEYLLQVTFTRVMRGEPVLSRTDMLTHMLPGIGHKLMLSLDSKRLQILWIELGRVPFIVHARLNEENI